MNDFKTNVEKIKTEKSFQDRILGRVLMAVLLLTILLFLSLSNILQAFEMIKESNYFIAHFLAKIEVSIIITLFIICLLSLIRRNQPFFSILSNSILFIGWMLLISSVALSLLAGPERLTNFVLIGAENITYIDGTFFLSGLLFLILGSIFKEAIKMQTELDETI